MKKQQAERRLRKEDIEMYRERKAVPTKHELQVTKVQKLVVQKKAQQKQKSKTEEKKKQPEKVVKDPDELAGRGARRTGDDRWEGGCLCGRSRRTATLLVRRSKHRVTVVVWFACGGTTRAPLKRSMRAH